MNLISYLGIFIIFYTKNKLLPIFTPFSILLLHRLYLYYYYIFYICTIFILYYYLLYYFKFYSKFHQFLSLSFLNLSAKNDRYRNSNTVTFHRNAPFEWSKLSHLENMCTPHENIVSEGKMFFFLPLWSITHARLYTFLYRYRDRIYIRVQHWKCFVWAETNVTNVTFE